ncbi:ribosome recycling factor [Mollicutes bacterium LVI A0039]|nr:ribosome recycling factor [Mollicutes bacterium LVI A0039]
MINEFKMKLSGAIEHLDRDLNKLRTGRANPTMLDGVLVSAYGSKMPLANVAMISIPEARQLLVKPFDPNTIGDVEKAILDANLGLNPTNDGETLRITIPQLTEELRRDIVKDAKKAGENSKITIRNIRKDAMDDVKKDAELTEDQKKSMEANIQDLVNEYNKKVDDIVKAKEADIMTI